MLGIVLIFDGLSDLYIIGVFSKAVKTVRKAAAEAEQEANAIETEGEVLPDDEFEPAGGAAASDPSKADADDAEKASAPAEAEEHRTETPTQPTDEPTEGKSKE